MNEEQLWQYLETVKGKDKLLEIINSNIEEINKKEAMYDSLAVDYRLAQEEIERLNNIIKEATKYIYLHSTQRKWFADISDRLHNQVIQFKGRIEDLLDILKDDKK